MRVGIIALLQESNTFLHEPTTLQRFEEDLLLVGEAVRRQLEPTHHEIGGFFAGLDEEGVEAVPLFAARALPFGVVTADTFDRLLALMFEQLDLADRLDGLLVAPHGATVSERYPDADGHWLSRLRQRVGPDLPIVGTLDPHANLSRQMVDSTNALIAYRTNPHVDQRQRGLDAADLLVRTLRGEVRPTQAASFPPLAISIECQLTSAPPCVPLYQRADAMLARSQAEASRPAGAHAGVRVLSNSILLGFPYADVPEMGSSFLVVTNNDQTGAQQLADELGQAAWSMRREFVGKLLSVADAVEQARTLPGPVCLLDMGDNVGGGSPGDGTLLAHALLERRLAESFVCLCDPEAVRQAEALGPGVRGRFLVGGKADDRHGPPLHVELIVQSLHEGRFEEPRPRHGGFRAFDQGRSAVLHSAPAARVPGLTILATSKRMVPFSLCQLTSCGLDPARFHVLVAKGVNAPVAAYSAVCQHFLRVNTPGVTTADLTTLPFHKRRRPMFPFEPEMQWNHG